MLKLKGEVSKSCPYSRCERDWRCHIAEISLPKLHQRLIETIGQRTENIDLDLQQGTSIGNIIVMTRLLVVSWALEKMNMRRKTHNQLNNVGEEKWHKSHHVTIDCKARWKYHNTSVIHFKSMCMLTSITNRRIPHHRTGKKRCHLFGPCWIRRLQRNTPRHCWQGCSQIQSQNEVLVKSPTTN